ncbi:glycosyltransferase family 39 protein [Candidatus Saccharibacteria bacterium]|nr:glycosyltransferase family 39 protein [Candidatus Saccharibacteria bacterium]
MSTTFAPNTSQPERASQPDSLRPRLVIGLTIAITAVVSIIAYIYFAQKGLTLSYKDAISHLQITGRVLTAEPKDAPAQFGGVWLPLQHILMLPFAWITPLYFNGFAGSLISMISYVVLCVYMYKIVLGLSDKQIPAIVAVVIVALNPNILYMQSTPMTELLLFATIAALVFHTQQWIQTNSYPHLFAAGLAAALGCLTRYEAWVLTFVFAVIVTIVALRRGGRKYADGAFWGFTFLAAVSAVGWVIWNQVIFGNALNFQFGEYAKPALWVGEDEPALGHLSVAIKAYWYAVEGNLGIATIVLALAGLVALAWRRHLDVLPVFGLLVMIPFFIFALEQGQRPLHVMQINGDLYNVRFGLLMIIPAAIAIGYLASIFKSPAWSTVMLFGASAATALIAMGGLSDAVTVREPVAYIEKGSDEPLKPTSEFLSQNYDGGKILMESFGNETILFDAEISLANNVYEGTYKKWEPALKDPAANEITWIVMRQGNNPDKVFQELHSSEQLSGYALAYENATYKVFKREIR